jgi:hypothetical protein
VYHSFPSSSVSTLLVLLLAAGISDACAGGPAYPWLFIGGMHVHPGLLVARVYDLLLCRHCGCVVYMVLIY